MIHMFQNAAVFNEINIYILSSLLFESAGKVKFPTCKFVGISCNASSLFAVLVSCMYDLSDYIRCWQYTTTVTI